MTTATATVKLPTEKLMRCLTCPLCHNLFTNATTISECLHTFCRDCISEKIAEEELEGCPICNTNLGGVPLEKLSARLKICRADHTMDDLREKIFPCKVRKEKEPEKTQLSSSSSVSLPTKRKEGSYTTTDSGTTKMLSTSTSQESFAKQQCLSTMIDHKKLNFDLNKQNNGQVMERITDDLNKKEASVTCSNDCKIQDTLAKAETIQIDDNYCNIQEHGNKPIMERVERGSYGTTSGSIEHEKLQDISREKRLASSNGSSGKLHDPLGDIDADRQCNKSSSPIWFALVASDHQEGNEPLPQISSNYLRVSDGSIPVSFIQKYLAKKLGLASEIEVEISFKGQPVSSTLHLHDIVELWRHTTTTVELIQISVGSSAKDFVMVLSYGRKCYHPGKFTNICTHLNNGVQ
ncbi:E3 ubiquitin protein ligase DRIP2-like isoform X1 [Cucumis melo]|uniref:E3 ubiquitin protein ligase DRIP2-like isoform X1 n=1 Tax=Cucumis melo TaxID=3656 RepID=A0ABM3KW74_CUCME|nr:E3 ubiquitin protein ligase DRIP2-like isoform X1 [Cucumis melo]